MNSSTLTHDEPRLRRSRIFVRMTFATLLVAELAAVGLLWAGVQERTGLGWLFWALVSSRFGASSRGNMTFALKGRAATARGNAPGLSRTKTRCKPRRGALSVLAARRLARPVGALRPLARFRVPGTLPLAVTAPHLRCYSTRSPYPPGRGAAGDSFGAPAQWVGGAWERGGMIQTRCVTFVEDLRCLLPFASA